MLNAKILSYGLPTADESNHSAAGMQHIHTTVPHTCSKLHCTVRFTPPPQLEILIPKFQSKQLPVVMPTFRQKL